MSAFLLLMVLLVGVPFCAGLIGGVCAVFVLIHWLEADA